MAITWPKNPKIDDAVTQINLLEARVAALETWKKEVDKAVADHWALRDEIAKRDTAARLDSLEAVAATNRKALRTLYTFLAAAPSIYDPQSKPIPNLPAVRGIVVGYLAALGGAVEMPV